MFAHVRSTVVVLLAGLILTGCVSAPVPAERSAGSELDRIAGEEAPSMRMTVSVNGVDFSATLAGNEASDAFAELVRERPLVIELDDYAGFEKVGSLGTSLPADDERIVTAPGDIMLYQGDQIVMFYGSNTWGYTPLAQVDNLAGWEGALGDGDVDAVFSIEE